MGAEAMLEISVPVQVGSLRAVRRMADHAGARASFDVGEIEDVRTAVTELCRTCFEIPAEATGEMLVRFYVVPGRITVRGFTRVEPGGPPMQLSRVSETLLTATVDDFELSSDEIVARFSLVKQGSDRG